MAAGEAWLEENLGTSAVAEPLISEGSDLDRDLALERIEFDSEAPDEEQSLVPRPEASPSLKSLIEIPWPKGLEPCPCRTAPSGEALPKADVLIVTWTKDEGHALSRVLTPGFDSQPPKKPEDAEPGMGYWKKYVKNYDAIAPKMSRGCPAVYTYQRLGTYWTTQIGSKAVVLFKSDSHMSQDGPRTPEKTPNRLVWKQIIEDCNPELVITTGTGGGIGPELEVGDVVVSRYVTFDPGGDNPKLEPFSCAADAPSARLTEAEVLLRPNAKFLPSTNRRAPQVLHAAAANHGVVTTKKFAYDDSANKFKLKGKGDVCEMGDAVLGLVCQEMGAAAPNYAVVRNASDPEIDSTVPDPGGFANEIYKNFGRWSTVCSAITCWGIVAAM